MKNVRNCRTADEAVRIRMTEVYMKLSQIKEQVSEPGRYNPSTRDEPCDWRHVGDLSHVMEHLEVVHDFLTGKG